MTWSESNGVLTHSGTDRTVYLAPSAQPSSSTIRVSIPDLAGGIFVVLYSSQDGGTCLEVGVEDDGLGVMTLTSRVVSFGVAGSDTTDATPIPAGEPSYLDIRIENGLIHAEVSASGFATTPINPLSIPADLAGFSAWGLSSEVDGAVVTSLEIVERTPVLSEAVDVLIAACGGDIWMSSSDTSLTKVGPATLASDRQPSFAEFDGLVYGVDGGRAFVCDAVNRVVFPWGALTDPLGEVSDANTEDWDDDVSGFFPGSTDLTGTHTKGTTDATVICTFNRRMYVANGRTLTASAIDAPHDYLLGQNKTISADGGAFLDGGWRDPILSMHVTPQNALVVGCTRSIWLITGDPIDGSWLKQPLSLSVGVSGPNAAHVGIGTPIVVHTPEGVQLVGIDGTPLPLSAPVLTEEIQFPYKDRDSIFTTVVRDPERYGLHVITTPKDGSVRRSYWYDERIGLYSAPNGGWFPDLMPSGMQPTCAVIWKGNVVFGCFDGYLRKFDVDKKTDDGVSIPDVLQSTTIDYSLDSDTIVHAVEMELGTGSDFPLMRFYGGPTAASAYDPDSRELLWTNWVQDGERKVVGVRSGVVVASIEAGVGNRRTLLEGVAIDTAKAGRMRRASLVAPSTPALGCGVGTATVPDEQLPDLPDGGGGGGGGGSDPDCPGENCSHATSTLSWLSEILEAGSIPVPTLDCCCATSGATVDVQLGRYISVSDTGQNITESATGSGALGTLIKCSATALIDGVTTSGYSIDLTIGCGMSAAWADEEDRKGFVAFVLGAGGIVDDAYSGVEIVSFDWITFFANCDELYLSWALEYKFSATSVYGKAAGSIHIVVNNREVGCT